MVAAEVAKCIVQMLRVAYESPYNGKIDYSPINKVSKNFFNFTADYFI